MNKIKLISSVLLSFICAGEVMAASPVFIGARDSAYVITHSTVNISSTPVNSTSLVATAYAGVNLPAVSGYRRVRIQMLPSLTQEGTTVFYTLNGSTANIYTIGWMVRLSTVIANVSPIGGGAFGGTNDNIIDVETNNKINIMTAPGVATVAARVIQYRLPN